ncbi:MAG: TIGR04086 family membrane protein [Thermomicrobiales bacterium]
MPVRVRWTAVLVGFLVAAVGTLVITPLLERVGLQVNAGPVDMLTMVSLLCGGFVAGRLGRQFEGIQGATVAILYIFLIWLGKQGLDEIHVANAAGLGALGKLDSWSNFGKDVFYCVAGALGGLWATPFNERERSRDTAMLRTHMTRHRPHANAVEANDTNHELAHAPADSQAERVDEAPTAQEITYGNGGS